MRRKAAYLFIALAVCGAGLAEAGPQANRAIDAMDFMLYEEAVQLFDQALAQDPSRAGLRVKQAYAYYRLNRVEKAAEVLGRELEIRPDDLETLILQSFVQYKAGRPDEAEKAAQKFQSTLDVVRNRSRLRLDGILRDLFPNAGVPAYILGLEAKKSGDVQAARSWFIQARALSYDPAACWIQAIDSEIDRKNWSEALRLCGSGGDISLPKEAKAATALKVAVPPSKKKAVVKTPAEVFLLMGVIYEEMSRAAESLEALKTAVAVKPFEAAALKNLAFAYYNLRDGEKAARYLGRVVKLRPEDVQARLLLEQVREGKQIAESAPRLSLSRDFVDEIDVRYRYVFGRNPDAIAEKVNSYALNMIQTGLVSDTARWLRMFIEIYENSPTIYYNLGQLYNSFGLNAEALKYGMKAVELKKDYREAYDLAANVWFKIGDFENAARYYEEVARLDTKDPLSYFNLGCAYGELGNLEKAEKNWLTAVRLENALPAGGEAAAPRKKGELDVAVNVKVEPISALACQSLGLLYAGQGKVDDALVYFLKAIELSPRTPLPYFEAGKILLGRGETARAREYFDKYLALGGDKAKVDALLKKLLVS
jgi:tetratricopeptide (TPR) repeat protein